MAHTKELICINCPLGCPLTATLDETGAVISVEGNTCPRGKTYAEQELTAPTRTVTSTVRVSGSQSGTSTVSCKTRTTIPKGRRFEVVAALKPLCVAAPIAIGDVLLSDAAGTGVDVIATREIL